jgi:hypothetical protein
VPHGKCSHATSKVDIDDISLTLNVSFKSPARDDLLINFLVSVFTSYKNLRSVRFNLGKMCVKQISSLCTITSHKRASLFLFRPPLLSRAVFIERSIPGDEEAPLGTYVSLHSRAFPIQTVSDDICATSFPTTLYLAGPEIVTAQKVIHAS